MGPCLRLKYPGEHGDEPDITSYGADGQPGGDGISADILSWKNPTSLGADAQARDRPPESALFWTFDQCLQPDQGSGADEVVRPA